MQIVEVDWHTLDRQTVANFDQVEVFDGQGNVTDVVSVPTSCRSYVMETPIEAMLVDLGDLRGHRQQRCLAGLTWERVYRDKPLPWDERRRRILYRRDCRTCFICGGSEADTVVRRVPRADGGTDAEANLAAAHYSPCYILRASADARRIFGTGPRGEQPPQTA